MNINIGLRPIFCYQRNSDRCKNEQVSISISFFTYSSSYFMFDFIEVVTLDLILCRMSGISASDVIIGPQTKDENGGTFATSLAS